MLDFKDFKKKDCFIVIDSNGDDVEYNTDLDATRTLTDKEPDYTVLRYLTKKTLKRWTDNQLTEMFRTMNEYDKKTLNRVKKILKRRRKTND